MAPPRPARAFRLVALIGLAALSAAALWPVARERLIYAPRVAAAFAAVEGSDAFRAAVLSQNEALAGETQAEIDARDATWIAERARGDGPLVRAHLDRPASAELRRIVSASNGVIRHAILMDDRGRNVAIAAPTGDYWQGDEAKYLRTFAVGRAAEHRSVPQRGHDGTFVGCWASRTVTDARTGAPIGAISLEVDAERAGKAFCGNDPAP
jgi:hypothetical protein